MRPTMRPTTSIVLGVVLALAGVYLAVDGEGAIVVFGWIMAVLAVVGIVANLWLHHRDQGRI